MTESDSKWLKVTQSDSKWLKVTQSDSVTQSESNRHGKCHFLYTIPILGKINLPQKVRNFWQYQICDKAAKAKKTINQLKIIQIQWKYNIISLKIP